MFIEQFADHAATVDDREQHIMYLARPIVRRIIENKPWAIEIDHSTIQQGE